MVSDNSRLAWLYEFGRLITSTLQSRLVSVEFSCVWPTKGISSDAEVEFVVREWFTSRKSMDYCNSGNHGLASVA